MELQLDIGKCNHCILGELREGADKEGLPFATEEERGGTTVLISGQLICWMPRIPDECRCPDKPVSEEEDDLLRTLPAIKNLIDHFEEHVTDLQDQIDHLKGRHSAHVREEGHTYYIGG